MQVIKTNNVPVKAWIDGVSIEDKAQQQLVNAAGMPFIYKWIAAMPDVHLGIGATIGSVIPTMGAIIPAAVGVDLGCGMCAVQLSIKAHQLPDNLHALRTAIEAAIPHGRTDNGGTNDRGSWGESPVGVLSSWGILKQGYGKIVEKYPGLNRGNTYNQLCTLGTGNHFIELCLDENQNVWVMLHSGSRGVGNRIGTFFIQKAKEEMEKWFIHLPDKDLAYLSEGSQYFDDYCFAVSWAQDFARINRMLMMESVLRVVDEQLGKVKIEQEVIDCHHNYIAKENHFNKNVWVTRKGAVRARVGDFGIIPGSMGAKSFIVKGKGNPDSFMSCSHGAGRVMSRTEAKKKFTLADHELATKGVECRKDNEVIDETPMAYKNIDDVMAAQSDLVEIVTTLKQVLCVKG